MAKLCNNDLIITYYYVGCYNYNFIITRYYHYYLYYYLFESEQLADVADWSEQAVLLSACEFPPE